MGRQRHLAVLLSSRQNRMPCQVYSWVIGSVSERRPLYGVKCDDLSAPTLGWQAMASLPRPVLCTSSQMFCCQAFTAPEPVPVIRYYSKAPAACIRFVRSCVASRSWRCQCRTTAIYNPKAKSSLLFSCYPNLPKVNTSHLTDFEKKSTRNREGRLDTASGHGLGSHVRDSTLSIC